MNLLELRFYPIQERLNYFKVSVEGSFGEVHHEPSLPFLDGEIPDVRDRRFTIVKVLESTKFNQNNFDELEQAWLVREQLLLKDKTAFKPQFLATIGRRLYQVLGQNIQQVIEAAVADAKRDRTWLHIRLRFPADDPKYVRLTDYPWELLHNDYKFLAHQGVTFSRYIAYRSPPPNLVTVERLNVLLISSGAGDERMKLQPLPSVEQEAIIQGLQKAQEQGKIQLELLKPPTLNTLRRRLLERQTTAVPHVLHFDSHGFFGKRCNECRKAYKQNISQCECGATLGEAQGYLVFEQSDGTADYVSATELGELLGNLERREQPNSEAGIALVVLSACRSGMSRLSESVFNGVAQNLIGQGIPSVVAMQYSISVSAASAFSEYFYRSLGEKEALAIALRRGQSAMGIEGNQWYRPALYLRWEDNEGGQLFIKTSAPSQLPGNTPETPPREIPSNVSNDSYIKMGMKTIKIFLASSSALKDDRKEFEIFINRKNKEYIKDNVFLELVLWEDFLDAMSKTRLQDEYNKAIAGCDVFVGLFHTKVGRYTNEEFLKALETFKANGQPLIYTYFKNEAINPNDIKEDEILSLLDFKKKLSDLGHFYTVYADINDLKFKFGEQLIKFIPKLTGISQNNIEQPVEDNQSPKDINTGNDLEDIRVNTSSNDRVKSLQKRKEKIESIVAHTRHLTPCIRRYPGAHPEGAP